MKEKWRIRYRMSSGITKEYTLAGAEAKREMSFIKDTWGWTQINIITWYSFSKMVV